MERLTVAALIPFKHYVHLRRTGKSRIVKYDNKKIILRSSLLPKPKEPLEVKYSRVGLRKLLKRVGISLRELRIRTLEGLPRERPYALYRLLLRLEGMRKRGISSIIKRLKAEVVRLLSYPGLVYKKALRRYVRRRIEEERRKGKDVSRVRVTVKSGGLLGRVYSLFGYKRIGKLRVKVSIERSFVRISCRFVNIIISGPKVI